MLCFLPSGVRAEGHFSACQFGRFLGGRKIMTGMKQRLVRAVGAAALIVLGTDVTTFAVAEEKKPSATIEIQLVEMSSQAGGQKDGGNLQFQGGTYPFKIRGLGVGGAVATMLGVSSLDAQGKVYDLKDVKDFPGTYLEARTEWVTGEKGADKLWIKNQKGVVISIEGEKKGLYLSSGSDGVVITMGQ